MFMRLRYAPKYDIQISVKGHKYLDYSINFIQSILFLALEELSIERSLAELLDIFLWKHSDKNIGMDFCLFVLFLNIFDDFHASIVFLDILHLLVNS